MKITDKQRAKIAANPMAAIQLSEAQKIELTRLLDSTGYVGSYELYGMRDALEARLLHQLCAQKAHDAWDWDSHETHIQHVKAINAWIKANA